MPDAPPTSTKRSHLYWLDWLRFLAAFAVVIDHTRSLNWCGFAAYTGGEGSPGLAVFISLGSLGRQAVVVFFVLSGWLVGGYTLERVRAGTFDAAAYAADRLARVYVPLLPALLFTMAVVRAFDGELHPLRYVICVFGLQDVSGVLTPAVNSPLWTLGYEIWFYVLAGCAAVACRRGSAGPMRLAGIAGAVLAVGICTALGWLFLLCWLVGIAGPWLRGRVAPAVRPWTAAAGALLMAASIVIYQIDEGILPPPRDDLLLPATGVAQLTLAIGALLCMASLAGMAPRTSLGRRIEQAGGRLAAFSYTLYLVHYPVLSALRASSGSLPAVMNLAAVLRALGWAATSVTVALAMYALFERQTPRVRRWLRAHLGEELPSIPRRPQLAPVR